MSKLSTTDKIILGSTVVIAGTGMMVLAEAKRSNKIADQIRTSTKMCNTALTNINSAIDRSCQATVAGNRMLQTLVGRTVNDFK